MDTKIAISQFKAHCLEIIEKLQTDHQPIIITKRDKPIAKVVPFDNQKASLFGLLKHKAEIKGDIIAPIDEKWNAQS
ncbi:MAG: antitoxin [Candidatus Amoebophilus sp. 36-38]|nr:MAG: antitoxin [Candidatus Amoebophilus sp. 36-38]